MRLHVLLIMGFALSIAGCAEKQEAATGAGNEPAADAPATAKSVDRPNETMATIEDWRDGELLEHMHAHAEQLDDINFALDEGDLDKAMTPAYWLSNHPMVKGLPEELKPFVVDMRVSATAVQEAQDLETARAAAKRIGKACQSCHVATGFVDE